MYEIHGQRAEAKLLVCMKRKRYQEKQYARPLGLGTNTGGLEMGRGCYNGCTSFNILASGLLVSHPLDAA